MMLTKGIGNLVPTDDNFKLNYDQPETCRFNLNTIIVFITWFFSIKSV